MVLLTAKPFGISEEQSKDSLCFEMESGKSPDLGGKDADLEEASVCGGGCVCVCVVGWMGVCASVACVHESGRTRVYLVTVTKKPYS